MYPTSFNGLTFGNLYVHEPGGALTNLILVLWGALILFRMAHFSKPFSQNWKLFVLFLSLASLGGIFTHGFPNLFSPRFFFILWGLKNMLIPLACFYGSMGFIKILMPERYSTLRLLFAIKALLIVVALFSTYNFTPVAIDLAFTYILIIILAVRSENIIAGASLFRNAFLIAVFSGIAYIVKIDIDPHWFTHKDIVHVFVYICLWLIYRGVEVYEKEKT